MKYFVISDVHSSYDEMIGALKNNGYDYKDINHKLLFLGDAFDKGKKPLETYLFFKDLIEKDKMIWILGNHDVELINVIKNKKYSHDCKDTPIKIASYYNSSINENTDIEIVCKTLVDNGVLDLLENKTLNYYELDNYVFTHGFIPTDKGKYMPSWREFPSDRWNSLMIRKGNGIKMVLQNNVRIPNKTLVCGHVGAYYGHFVKDHPKLEINSKEFNRIKNIYSKDYNNYHTFKSEGVINIDANGYKTGFINVLVLEDNVNGK